MMFANGTGDSSEKERATAFIKENLQDYLYELQKESLGAGTEVIKENAKSKFVKKVQGTIWRFHDLETQLLDSWGPEQAAKLKGKMAYTTIVITEKAILTLSKDQAPLFLKKIDKETSNGIEAMLLSLDRLSDLEATITLTKDGNLTYSIDENATTILTLCTIEDLEAEMKAHIRATISKDNFKLLGASVEGIADAIWS